jgi:hypothetical protein
MFAFADGTRRSTPDLTHLWLHAARLPSANVALGAVFVTYHRSRESAR